MAVDKVVTEEIGTLKKAGTRAGRYNKRLVSEAFLSGVSGAHNKARSVHRLLTLPWEDDGTRVLAATGFITYQKKMRECKRAAEKEVDLFLNDRDAFIRDAKSRLGDMFNEAEYPSVEVLKAKFGFDVEIKGLPEAADFRAALGDEHVKAIIKDIERRGNERLANAMNDVFERIKAMVEHMAQKLRDYVPPADGERAQGIIRDSVVGNIYELATEVLPVLNITNDPRIEELRVKMLHDLTDNSVEILRSDASVRAETMSKADAILAKVRKYIK
jgi:hypothetical protein